ncbi:lipopolysaccharide biosynthesis protein [Microbacterium sp. NPDC055521]
MTGTSARSRPSGATAALRGGGRLVGFGLSVALLAASSLLLIPAMVDAGGQRAWGAIAVGQSIGAVAAVVIYFGWGHTGPATIARTDAESGRREFSDSLRTRLALFAPVALLCSGLAALVSPSEPLLAAVGCLSAASVGFTADWYFVGSRRPFAFLALETAPRVVGSLVGIGLLMNGAPVIVGPVSMLGGMLVGFAATSWWVLRRRPAAVGPARSVREVIIAQRHGVGSGAGTAAYGALPLVLISLVTPGIQPSYALVDKLQRQLSVALGPIVSVVQGYVPRPDPAVTIRRSRHALLVGAGFSVLLAAGVLVAAPWLLSWLGAGQLQPPYAVMVLMALFVGLNVWESILARAVLASFDRLDAVARGTVISAAVGLPLVIVGALAFGLVGAFSGVLLGLAARAAYELVVAVKHARRALHPSEEKG